MVVDKYAGRCLDVGSTPTGSIFFIHGRLLKRLKRPCWKRGRRVKACVGSNPMSSVRERKADQLICFFVICLKINIVGEFLTNIILSLFGDMSIDVHGCF